MTEFLAGISRWDQWFAIDKLKTALPSFEPTLTIADRIEENVRWFDQAAPPTEIPDLEDEALARLGSLVSDKPISD